ncbi:hypothetical protein GDO86_004784 [Hymenochirus boettgeri]|uniref:Uncharacterized protein n=1 Tax=Hymenochirus boettgeri TaxID=247094 RepID=A0A8T2KFD0_9PIPI|nr:hypothetical protein GDO86_004784 [Hymenochirus boettgeri]
MPYGACTHVPQMKPGGSFQPFLISQGQCEWSLPFLIPLIVSVTCVELDSAWHNLDQPQCWRRHQEVDLEFSILALQLAGLF